MSLIVSKRKSYWIKTTVNINVVMENVSMKVRCAMKNLNVLREKRKKAVIKMILTLIIIPSPIHVILKMVAVITYVLKMGFLKLVLAKKGTN